MKQILIVNRHPKLTISHSFFKKNIISILSHLDLLGSSVEITLVNDALMRKLNKKYMHKIGTTDVLSFPQISVSRENAGKVKYFKKKLLGDIIISLDQAKKQAKAQKIAFRREVLFLTLHSILHLIGFDHDNEKERIRMQKLESAIWRQLI